MAVTITKRDGRKEEFNPQKLARSLKSCGASDELVDSTVARAMPKEGESTSSLRERVSAELGRLDNRAARCYQSTRRLKVAEADDVPAGTVRVHPTTASNYGWQPGEKMEVEHDGEKVKAVLAESASAGPLQVQMSRQTLESLRVFEGSRVAISRL